MISKFGHWIPLHRQTIFFHHTLIVLDRKYHRPWCANQLPAEIRLKIWRRALPDARIFKLLFKDEINYEIVKGDGGVPALLHTNVEARTEALRFYTLMFGAIDNRPQVR